MTDHTFVSFNISENVRVKLTPAGIEELKSQTRDLNTLIVSRGGQPLRVEPYVDSEGYYYTQLYSLMNQFGHMMNLNTLELPFVDNRIEIEIHPE